MNYEIIATIAQRNQPNKIQLSYRNDRLCVLARTVDISSSS
jgi:hypothetical protein